MRILNILQWILLNWKFVRIQRKLLYILCDNMEYVVSKMILSISGCELSIFCRNEYNQSIESGTAQHQSQMLHALSRGSDAHDGPHHTPKYLFDWYRTHCGRRNDKSPPPTSPLRECLSSGQQITSRYVRINGDIAYHQSIHYLRQKRKKRTNKRMMVGLLEMEIESRF